MEDRELVSISLLSPSPCLTVRLFSPVLPCPLVVRLLVCVVAAVNGVSIIRSLLEAQHLKESSGLLRRLIVLMVIIIIFGQFGAFARGA